MPGIHVFASIKQEKTWMAGTSPAMTTNRDHPVSIGSESSIAHSPIEPS
jgi:hypothetical protein